jgi:hypothetical protein
MLPTIGFSGIRPIGQAHGEEGAAPPSNRSAPRRNGGSLTDEASSCERVSRIMACLHTPLLMA